MNKIVIEREDLYHEISNLAYIIADTRENTMPAHTLHQTYDICEEGNRERIDHILSVAFMEACCNLRDLVYVSFHNVGPSRPIVMEFRQEIPDETCLLGLQLTLKDYLVSRALGDWLSVTLPPASTVWKENSTEALRKLRAMSIRHTVLKGRRLSPF